MEDDRPLLEWGVAGWTMQGEAESGDLAVVQRFDGGALAAVVDGLGHGREAARAAKAAVRVLRRFAGEPLDRLVERSHEALRVTRGAVMSIACFRAGTDTMSWVGVGTVEARLVTADGGEGPPHHSMIPQAGIVGYNLPAVHPSDLQVRRGDTLIFITDGVRSDVAQDADVSTSPKELARRILAEGSKGTDDALVLVTRYLGDGD